MANLVELFDNIVQMQNLNGVPLANGKMYVYALGRTRLMDTWSDVDGESLNSNPIILDAAGQCHCYVSTDFDYTIVVCDAYDNEIFSIDKYLYSQGSHSHSDVAVAPSETIAVSSYHVGETTVYVPYLTGQLGKVYTGIEPIVVNNVVDKISAQHVPLGVQDPLYFVQDDEEGCIIGFSGQTIPEGVMSESALGFENNKITGYNGSAFSAGNEYEAGSYVDITDNTISVTGLQPEGDYAYNSALSSKLDVTATGQFLTGLPEDLVYSADITGLATTAQLDEKLDKSDSANFYPMNSNPSGYLTGLPSDLATTGWVDSQGYLTAVDIPESAVWNATTQTVSANSAQWVGGTANPQIPVTSTSGISIFESGNKVYFNISADYAFTADLTGKQDSLTFGYKDTAISSIDNSALYDNSAHARITTLAGRITDLSSNKLDTAIYAEDSGKFLTAHQSLTDYQTTAGMTAYQPVGSYLTTADSANFYPSDNPSAFITGVDLTPYQTVEGMTAYQPVGDYLTTGDSANFYTTANESGYITGVPAGTMNESAFGYDVNNKISGYNGSAFAGGSDIPEGVMVESGLEYNADNEISAYNGSAFAAQLPEEEEVEFEELNISGISAATDYVTATSANIDSTIDNVSANSGAWGGSALPISAGPGIKFEMVNDTLVASTDETVLYSGFKAVGNAGNATYELNEEPTNFNTVKVLWALQADIAQSGDMSNKGIGSFEFQPNAVIKNYTYIHSVMNGNNSTTGFSLFDIDTNINNIKTTSWDVRSVLRGQTNNGQWFHIYKVIGINRIAGGN